MPSYLKRQIVTYAFDPQLSGRRMVWICGPRQVGKTFLARVHLRRHGCSNLYFNWDDPLVRQAYLKNPVWYESAARQESSAREVWLAFDEIHKRPRWRDILKGAYDRFGQEFRFLVTGSARLDLFRKGGDSLAGRYSLFHLGTLNLREASGRLHSPMLSGEDIPASTLQELLAGPAASTSDYEALRDFPPFPEPFLSQSRRGASKWQRDYLELVTREDLRDLSGIREVERISQLVWLLPQRVGSPLSMAEMGRLLEAAHTSVRAWLEQLRRLCVAFPVMPWSRRIARAMRRERKWYLFDHSLVENAAARFENLVAAHLWRATMAWSDMGFGRQELYYLRTHDKTEIDFVLTRNGKPWLCVEAKLSDTQPSRALMRRAQILGTPTLGLQVVEQHGVFAQPRPDLWVVSANRFLPLLP